MNQSVERARQRARLERLFVGVAVLGVMAAVSVSAQRGGCAHAAPASGTDRAAAAAAVMNSFVSMRFTPIDGLRASAAHVTDPQARRGNRIQ